MLRMVRLFVSWIPFAAAKSLTGWGEGSARSALLLCPPSATLKLTSHGALKLRKGAALLYSPDTHDHGMSCFFHLPTIGPRALDLMRRRMAAQCALLRD